MEALREQIARDVHRARQYFRLVAARPPQVPLRYNPALMAPAAPRLLLAITRDQRRTLVAAALGWMLDAFDVMLYALVLTHIMRDLGMSKALGGGLATLTLLASGFGGMLFGSIADRIGRKRALMLSILTYSVCSFASGLSTSIAMLAVFRFILGLGMGGEWNTGATLVAETWPTHLRAKAIALVQSSWAIGYAAAALVAWGVFRLYPSNWRAVFFVGVLPALVTLWIQKDVPESEMWKQHREPSEERAPALRFAEIFSRQISRQDDGALLPELFRDVRLVGALHLGAELPLARPSPRAAAASIPNK